MTAHEQSNNQGIQVDSSLYTTAGYCIPGRFASYAYQIQEILDCGAKTVLEIGPGNGVVTYVLRKAGIHVDTLDHDPALKTNFVASVLDLPFKPNSYDAVLCCQVLEHIPWKHFSSAMKEISIVAKSTILLSLPHLSRYYNIAFQLPILGKKNFSLDFTQNFPMKFDGEHYWEIGKGVKVHHITSVFKDLNLNLNHSYRIPEFRYHQIFCISKTSFEIPLGKEK